MVRSFSRSLVGIALAVVLGSSASAATISASSRGWYSQAGQHPAGNGNTMTGKLSADSGLRSFFVFDLGAVSEYIGSGVLRLEVEGYFGLDPMEFVAVYDVDTNLAELVLGQSGRTDIYDDLGGGVAYGAILVQPSDVGTVIEIPLTPEAIDAVNLAAGGRFAVGLHVETLMATGSTEGVRFSRGNEARVHQLVLTEAPPSVSVDPSLAAMVPPSDHAVTAHVANGAGDPLPGAMVAFRVESGPNAGVADSVAADADGAATFAYAGSAMGVDRIQVSLPDAANASPSEATAFWDDDCNGNGIPDQCDLSCGGFDGECAAFAACGGSLDEDASGFPDECEVAKNAPPACGDAMASRAMLPRADGRFREVAILGVTDPDGDPVQVVVDAVHQDEAVAKRRHHRGGSPDARGVGEGDRVAIRAESSERGNGRVYHLSFAADDGLGGACSGTVRVCVPRPGWRRDASCIDEGPLFDSTEGAAPNHGKRWGHHHHHRGNCRHR